MIERSGIDLGTVFQGGTLAALVIALTWWIRGMPERLRVANEAKALDHSEAAILRTEMIELNKRARNDIHDLRNQLAVVDAKQIKCTQALAEAHAENRLYRDDMSTLLFLFRLMVSEVKRLDPDPENNMIIKQAEMVLAEMERRRGEGNGVKHLAALADEAVVAAAVSLDAAVVTKNEIKGEVK